MGIRGTARLLLEKAFVERYLKTLSGRAKSPDLLTEFITDERLQRAILVIEAAFPRFEIFLEDTVAEGQKVAVRGLLRGVHSGKIMGITPTRKQVAMSFTVIFRMDGGKIVEHWPSVDLFGLLQQLDATTVPALTMG